ncbi:CRISPR-associated endonuclease/helicase Cas3 [Streptoalloteichus tenebrarius]|uniref:CRISPR-associated endonuclease/helicase Cas3 n=1 Tax=Streptoalloteichus tenebrarius (strain ATCC 17920 / DSM 40477 / JCM 4838 / CBS 697.72 / NBRC 16177 / NCIMB 11028 / NRRL B-12390 / A12253. 1 / ISP 5477) TaxID=1933 RepID=A0ABT1I1I1_STRSD|nr:type I-U CRISPR-associated helicase/endonuclease Cas3 [Streptoalloteichus tenebrarius]MCP2261644.1 CRISPR-associated endonuclease/helicase Cas3 [Streptoalloteichus tenebrarius]BFE99171.1 type I-U CRISPR-associated helicase/endonuclease Cas3 [Streptoalloteichus tenebrarius]
MSNADYDIAGFAAFVRAVHGKDREPFPWQTTLAELVLRKGQWPEALDVPTGLGKTSVLDLAVYAAAAGTGPRRVFFVVDRRLVVDEAFTHAQHLAAAINTPATDACRRVAHGLRALSETAPPAEPVMVTRMRGGTTWDWRWLDRPDRFSIVVGTVDQIGSRLLFRAYGTSRRLAPIDAALVGTDSVVFVDEAHLAQPLLDTLNTIRNLDRPERTVRPPVQVVSLTATHRKHPTPAQGGEREPAVTVFDLDAHREHDEAARRLDADKTLITATCPERALTDVLVEATTLAAEHRPGGLIGVVVNTVARAREVFTRLQRRLDPDQCLLLIGRSRLWDRDRLLAEWAPRITVGWRNHAALPTRIVVATQTVECGANLDFDGLVTESAPWDALVQRLGRLNRVGQANPATALVVHATSNKPDIVYGPPRENTWAWLASLVPPREWAHARAVRADQTRPVKLNVSPAALRGLVPPAGATSTPALAPMMLAQHLDGWVRTAPIPIPDTPVNCFLHGFDTSHTTVRVVWRADLDPDQPREWKHLVGALPPRAEETLEVSLAAVRSWLRGIPPTTVLTDLPDEPGENQQTAAGETRPVLRMRPDEDPKVVHRLSALRPDDLIVVPASYGGLDRYGWNPDSTTPVLDVADLVARRHPLLRLNPATLLPVVAATGGEETALRMGEALRELADHLGDDDQVRLPTTIGLGNTPIARSFARLLDVLTSWWPQAHPTVPVPPVLPTRLRLRPRSEEGEGLPIRVEDLLLTTDRSLAGADTGADASSGSTEPLELGQHHNEVQELAKVFATNLTLPDDLVAAVGLAAGWHDLGKLDLRFQVMLRRGSHRAAEIAERPLAKSGIDPTHRAALARAHKASGYPKDGRHEVLSAALAGHLLTALPITGVDEELVVHLIAAHHGHGRPLHPPVDDPHTPTSVTVPAGAGPHIDRDVTVDLTGFSTVDWESCDRFTRLNQRYGHWGLALLEAIVRLADIACSAGEHHDLNLREKP